MDWGQVDREAKKAILLYLHRNVWVRSFDEDF